MIPENNLKYYVFQNYVRFYWNIIIELRESDADYTVSHCMNGVTEA